MMFYYHKHSHETFLQNYKQIHYQTGHKSYDDVMKHEKEESFHASNMDHRKSQNVFLGNNVWFFPLLFIGVDSEFRKQ